MAAYESPEAAYWAFFETFNARSASGRAGVMSYPHVRVAATRVEPSIQQTAAEFEASASWDQFDRVGWAWTQPITPRVVHSMSDKVHFAGGWTRYRADGSVISRNRLLYIATRMDDGWGIQGALGVEGHLEGAAAQSVHESALTALRTEMQKLEAGDADAWLDCFHLPSVIVFAPGQLEIYENREALAAAYRDWASEPRPISYEARVTAAGPRAALIEQSVTSGGDHFEQVSLFVERGSVWASAAVSAVRPDM